MCRPGLRVRCTTQSVFAGSYSVQARVTTGTPIITVKPNSATPEQVAGAGAEEAVDVSVSHTASAARIVDRQPRQATGRPDLAEAAIVVSGGRGTGGNLSRSSTVVMRVERRDACRG